MLQSSPSTAPHSQLVQKYRSQRREAAERHPQLDLGSRPPSPSPTHAGRSNGSTGLSKRVRHHPRWASLHLDPQPSSSESLGPSANPTTTDDGRRAFGPNFIPEEQTLRNDYAQRFVDTGAGELPGNAVRNPHDASRFDEYPKLKRLVQIKDSLVTLAAHPPTYLCADLRQSLAPYTGTGARRGRQQQGGHPVTTSAPASGSATPQGAPAHVMPPSGQQPGPSPNPAAPRDFHLGTLMPVKYDVVLIDPPLASYEWEGVPSPSGGVATWTWDEIAALPVPQVAAKESFVFLWVGSGAGDGLERGREVLSRWGYRRCEDIVWVRTNAHQRGRDDDGGDDDDSSGPQQPSTSSALTRCVQHCLMGIRGTVRRSTDTRFVHCNVDTDVILWPGEAAGEELDMTSKPPEMYRLIENFCLGTRRLELFGRNRNLRRGWLTVGLEVGPGQPGWPADGRLPLPAATLSFLEEQRSQRRLPEDGPAAEEERAHLDRLAVPVEYDKLSYDVNFGVDRPGCELRDRINLVPFSDEGEALRPKSPPPRGTGGAGNSGGPPRGGTAMPGMAGGYLAHSGGLLSMPSGLSASPALRLPGYQHDAFVGGGGAADPSMGMMVAGAGGVYGRPMGTGGGAGLSGLGAGGPRTVSVPSGSDTLSGPQASVLKAKAAAAAAAQAHAKGPNGSR
ncbi:uncharacterized protein PFL1_01537 [Pseudozyma flocculosa PF-1]|uniref:Related to KAR4 - transcription factor required for gene regulation in response to pheromones n=1 Tax=Pseudozyma flocculosa TaxID=84751 RepID=A0A5C3EY53_9BASI|nr:uncharacterized protein PFL1_01537 [Pseudozyma flocculosa PF-1]EPQ30636.1 hypothetical protein PFL1_01537 [Pseudozyma flocculosa PF-1]SPO37032.1 related to KAR4 - transcription factor required for gene regulation in response to pheromones [Pseudozyma flocculosa]